MLRTLFCCLLLGLSAVAVSAEPLTITQGTITNLGPDSNTVFLFNVSGPNWSLNARTAPSIITGTAPCSFCRAGQTVNMGSTTNTTMFWSDWFGTITVNGTTHNIGGSQSNNVGGFFSFSGPSVVIPVSTDPTLTFTGPCGGGGSVYDGFTFSYQLGGTCNATMILNNLGANLPGTYNLRSVTYDFGPAAVPEPTTMILLCSGLVGLAAKLRSRRH